MAYPCRSGSTHRGREDRNDISQNPIPKPGTQIPPLQFHPHNPNKRLQQPGYRHSRRQSQSLATRERTWRQWLFHRHRRRRGLVTDSNRWKDRGRPATERIITTGVAIVHAAGIDESQRIALHVGIAIEAPRIGEIRAAWIWIRTIKPPQSACEIPRIEVVLAGPRISVLASKPHGYVISARTPLPIPSRRVCRNFLPKW